MSGAISATTLGIIGGVTAAGSIGAAAIGANAAGNAADAQTSAANRAADLSAKSTADALDFQKKQWETTQANEKPWLTAGTTALDQLSKGTAPGGSLVAPYSGTFQAPTDLTMQNDPGFMARLKLGTDEIQKSAAARGSVVTGGTAKALETYGQDYGSNEYSKVYDRALSDYTTKYNTYNNDQTNQFNRLSALSNLGQTTATQLGTLGQTTANGVSSTLQTGAGQQGAAIQNAGAATASGYVGAANAWSGGIGGVTNNLTNLALLGSGRYGGGGWTGGSGGGGVANNLGYNANGALVVAPTGARY